MCIRDRPTIVTNCSNNYGPYQFPEKLIPLFINNIRQGKELPVYGKGENVRDWLYVEDHARAIDIIFHKGKIADTYNIGGFNEWKNIDLIKVIIKTDVYKRQPGELIRVVKGPLKGLEGELVEVDGKAKVVVRLDLLGCAGVDMPVGFVEKMK